MKLGSGKALGVLCVLAATMVAAPTAASARPGLDDAVWTVHGHGASTAASINVLTLTVGELIALMNKSGLKDSEYCEAEYHNPQCDMRIVGTK